VAQQACCPWSRESKFLSVTVSMKRGRAETIIAEVREVVTRWREYADEAAVTPRHRDQIQRTLRLMPFD
jgi:serine/threonine-protein kinase HipA